MYITYTYNIYVWKMGKFQYKLSIFLPHVLNERNVPAEYELIMKLLY